MSQLTFWCPLNANHSCSPKCPLYDSGIDDSDDSAGNADDIEPSCRLQIAADSISAIADAVSPSDDLEEKTAADSLACLARYATVLERLIAAGQSQGGDIPMFSALGVARESDDAADDDGAVVHLLKDE